MKDTESSATLSSRQREQGPTGYQKSLPRFAILITVVGVLVVLSIRTASAHINSLLPNQWTAGGPAFTLRMLGTDIDQSDTGRVLFNGTRVAATLVMAGTPGELQATIPANLITSPGVVRVELEGFPPAADFTINPPPTITTGFQLPDAVPGQAYSQRLQVSGGTAPFTWTSTLPAGYGLSLSPDGLISGTAIATETAFEFQATVTDAATVRAVRNFGIRIRYPCASEAPCLFIEDTQVTEGDTGPVAAVFNVRLSRPSAVPVTVVATTQDFTATAPNDYTARTGPLTINAGATLTTIAVPVNGDTVYEAHEQFYLNLTNPVNATIARAQGTCTISDNDPGSLMLCSTDTPKRADISQPFDVSTISVNRDGLIDNVKVSLFFDSGPAGGPVDQLKLVLRSPIGLEAKLLDPSEFIAPSLAGHVLGTTCSPSPNFIFDDLAPTTVYRGGPSPYVGSFKPQYGLSSFGRLSARGAWQLQFNTSTNRQENVLNCWCLTFDLPREGLRLTPESATARIFFPHILQAIVTSGGAPVRDQPVSFTVRGEHDEIRFETQEKSDFEGVAELSYYDLKPGLNFIEARATVNGALSIAKAQVTWVADWPPGTSLPRDNKCPINFSDPDGGVTLSTARDFRDDVLAKTQRGRKYTQLYYQFSTEAVQIMMFNPMLTLRSREIVERYQPLIRDMVNGKSVTLTDGDLAEIDGFMNAFAAKGSPELKEAVKVACHDLRDPEMHAEFGIAISAGPKRKSAHGNRLETIEQVGGLTILSGVVGMVFIAASRSRPKALRRNAGRVLVVLLSVTTVANSRQRSETGHEPKRDGLIPLAKDHLTNIPGKMPISFEPNQGQTDPRVRFIARGEDYSVYLTSTEVVLALATRKRGNALLRGEGIAHTPGDPFPQQASTSNCVLRMKLLGANPEPSIYGLDRLHSTSNYFIGDDPAKWRTGIPSFARIKYQDIYPGVDLLCYGDPDNFEYDFAITPGVDPNCIRLNFAGADKIEVDAAGDLVTSMPGGQVREHRPLVHQVIDGARRMIPSRYVLDEIDSLTGDSASAMRSWNVRFEVGPYDVSRDLIIDPALEFSTYLGGKGDDEGNAITLDSAGNAYVIGFTDSPNFPTANAAQRANGGGLQDAFVAKVDPSGTRLLYSTFIGGNGQDNGNAIAVDAAGNAYITGYTGSTNFPTLNAMQRNKSGQFNAFVAKMNPAGALVYSTHLGGSVGDFGSSIAVDAEGNAYVAGVTTSPNFPIVNALQSVRAGAADVFAAKLNPSGSSLVYSTFLGGAADDGCTSLAIDPQGNAYLTGVTSSPNFRTANPLQPAHGGGLFDAFVAKLNTTGTQLVYSTYLGGSGEDRGFRIAVDAQGNAFVTGDTDSANFPIARALQPVYGGGVDAFVAKLNPSGTGLTYSTYLGGSSIDGGTAIAVDPTGSACVTGFTGSTNFPTVASIQPAFGGGAFDCFVARLNAAGSSLDYSTYLGGRGTDSGFGVAAGASGDVYVMGITDSADFPTSTPYQPAFGGGSADVFIARIKSSGPALARAEIQGKNLLVFGGGFDVGSKILLNGQEQRTRNDELNPTGVLFGKKVGKLIAPGETVTLQVRNSDGTLSNQIRFTRQ